MSSLSKRITERSALSVFGTAANSQVAEDGQAWKGQPTIGDAAHVKIPVGRAEHSRGDPSIARVSLMTPATREELY